ncbi:MAG: hypothetical protein M3P93_00615 [Actinomycetota bacterium]|nr:hypothetical protein [Actinomycetota bacterium]
MLKRKALSGSDFPLITPERWLADVRALDLKPEVLPLILKDNGARVLGLREGGGAGVGRVLVDGDHEARP